MQSVSVPGSEGASVCVLILLLRASKPTWLTIFLLPTTAFATTDLPSNSKFLRWIILRVQDLEIRESVTEESESE